MHNSQLENEMKNLIKIKEAIIVEGKYDKIRLESLIDGLIIPTDGFRIFKHPEKQAMLRRLAEKCGLLILTDSDSAGFIIRNFIHGIVPSNQIKHAYIPDILGKEGRKDAPSKEGKLGVEGMETSALLAALRTAGINRPAGCAATPPQEGNKSITKTMLFEDGLSGGKGSKELRRKLLSHLNLPENMTANAMLDVINALLTAEEYREIVSTLLKS